MKRDTEDSFAKTPSATGIVQYLRPSFSGQVSNGEAAIVLQDMGSFGESGDSASCHAYASGADIRFSAEMPGQRKVAEQSVVGGMAKRSFDLALSILALPLATGVALLIALLVALSGGNIIYAHARVGRNGRPFRCYKFRTMKVEAENELRTILERDPVARQQWLEQVKLENDPRVTPLGRWLRRTCLDEVPQIWNVLRGDMSWVGPRPVVADEIGKYGRFVSSYLACRPGVTGLWQIQRRSGMTYAERVAFDVEYARKWSLARDLMILFLTIPRIVFARDDG
jgi:lipopolysaccharide/colanic/teichoic acid biosynthesis glycosyltransferase